MNRARLIALDWGTSNLRAMLLGDDGVVLDSRAGAVGVMVVRDRQFGDALEALCGDWIAQHRCPLIASGMIGSRQGWQEAPYLDCPAGLAQAAARLLRIDWRADAALHVVPGLRCVGSHGEFDVMRGEETQLWGAHLAEGDCCVLPGTHSKWAWSGASGAIDRFQTVMTGELFALLTQHGILGRLMTFGSDAPQAYERGVRLGLAGHAQLMHTIFAARTAGLMDRVAPAALPDFLSGILIGAEVGSMLPSPAPACIALLGDAGLCARYEVALQHAGVRSLRVPDQATTRGLWRIALQAGLIEESR